MQIKTINRKYFNSRINNVDVQRSEKWLGYLVGTISAAAQCGIGHLPECLLYRCAKANPRMGWAFWLFSPLSVKLLTPLPMSSWGRLLSEPVLNRERQDPGCLLVRPLWL